MAEQRPPGDKPMFSRDSLLGGLPARRASTVLFAIESRTAGLVRSSRVNRAAYVGERTVAEQEQAFLAALSGARGQIKVHIEDIERHAQAWANLVPASPDVRAAIARLLGSKYRFTWELVPGIRRALGLDDALVAQAYERLHGGPISGIYATELTRRERSSWFRARITRRFEDLPPFWIAYFLALTETIGEGILIVPIALAGIGPLPGVVLLILLGLANIVTLAGLAEAVTRNGSMRYGAAYFGRLVGELLGPAAATAQSVALGLFNLVVLFAYLLGFASVFAGATGVPEGVWVLVLFGINVFYLRKESLDDTIASAVVIGIINVSLVVVITLLAATKIDPAKLAYADVPILNGQPPDASTVGLIFGVLLVAYFGHTSVANASKLILTRDPGGRSLLWGNVAALGTVIALYCFAVLAIGGALGPEPLLETRGTAITPLANVVGPGVSVIGGIYVVLAIGLGSIYVSLGIYNQVIELIHSPGLDPAGVLARLSATRRTRLAAGLAPIAAIVVVLEILLAFDAAWFAGPIGYIGVLAVPLVGGVFPMLLVAAARRKGEYVPARVIRVIGHPVTVIGVTALFLSGVVLHGLVIWQEPVARIAALLVGVGTFALLIQLIRAHVFRSRTVIEVRIDEVRRRLLTVTRAGRRVVANEAVGVATPAREGGDLVVVALEEGPPYELRVWGHSVTPDGHSSVLPVSVTLAERSVERSRADPLLLPLDGRPVNVVVRLEGADAPV